MKIKKRVLAILIATAMIATFTIHAAAYNTGAGDLAMMVEVDAGEAGNVPIYDWLMANNGAYALDEIEFELYKSDEDGSMIGAVIGTSTIGTDSMVTFKNVPVGWYLVREVLNDASVLLLDTDDQLIHFYFDGTEIYDAQYFDFDAFYTIVNGYGYGYTLGYPGLNNTGDIFPIAVTNTSTEVVYPSFCAHAGSKNFAGQSGLGCDGYLVAEPGYLNFIEGNAKHSDFLKAYNYICDTYGDLNEYRAVTQIITWALLGSIEVPSEEFDNIAWDVVETGAGSVSGVSDAKAIVEDVMANYKNHSGSGAIVDVIYLYCEHHHDASDCQPQLVPVYSVASNDVVVKVGGFVNTPAPQQPDEPQTQVSSPSSLTIGVTKALTDEAGQMDGAYTEEFTFSLSLLVNGNAYDGDVDVSDITLKAGDSDEWGPFVFDFDDADAQVVIEYTVTESQHSTYVLESMTIVRYENGEIADLSSLEFNAGTLIRDELVFLNGLKTQTTDPDPETNQNPDPDPDPNPNPDPDPNPNRTRTRTTDVDPEEFVYFEDEIPLVNIVWTEDVVVAEITEPMEFEEVGFYDDIIPLSQMPQTGLEDSMALWILALYLSLLASGITIISIVKTKKK